MPPTYERLVTYVMSQESRGGHQGEETEGLVNDAKCILHVTHIFVCLFRSGQKG